jgi:hypothetical protein
MTARPSFVAAWAATRIYDANDSIGKARYRRKLSTTSKYRQTGRVVK